MPCDQIILNTVDIGKVNPSLAKRALAALGASYVVHDTKTGALSFSHEGDRVTIQGGKMEVRAGREALADTFKVAYSREVVQYTAARNGWELAETSANVFAVVKH